MPLPERNEEALEELVNLLKGAALTVSEIESTMKISERTVYRWLGYLKEEGHDVVKRTDAQGQATYGVVGRRRLK